MEIQEKSEPEEKAERMRKATMAKRRKKGAIIGLVGGGCGDEGDVGNEVMVEG